MLFAINSTSLIQRVLLKDSNDDPITAVAFDDASLALSYNLQTVGSWVTPTLVDGTLGTYLENSWKEIGGGVYQWCPPNAVVVANTNTLVRAVYGANDPQYDTIEARLPAGGTVSTAVVVARVPVGSTAGWPEELIIGDAYLTTTGTAPSLFIRDIDDTILSAMGSKGFADADFVGTLRLSPLTSATRDLDTPATTIEVDSADSPGIVFNDTTPGAEYFELQIPNAQTILGVIKTRYSAQFIMNWGITREYESSVNLGEIKFIRKNAAKV